jgi:hypothetical protein
LEEYHKSASIEDIRDAEKFLEGRLKKLP